MGWESNGEWALRHGNDEAATNAINDMRVEWQPYAKRYWSHLQEDTRQPDWHDFDISDKDDESVRIALAHLV